MFGQRALSPRMTGILMSALVLLPGMGLVVTQQRNENRCGQLLDTQRRLNRWTDQRKPFVVDVAVTKSDGSTVNTTAEVFPHARVSKVVTTAPDTTVDVTWLLADLLSSRVYESAFQGDWPEEWTSRDGQPAGVVSGDFGLRELIRQCEKRNGIMLEGGVRFENAIGGDVEFMRVTAALDADRIAASRKRLASFRVCEAGGTCDVQQLKV
jgi:hypothetical protein